MYEFKKNISCRKQWYRYVVKSEGFCTGETVSIGNSFMMNVGEGANLALSSRLGGNVTFYQNGNICSDAVD